MFNMELNELGNKNFRLRRQFITTSTVWGGKFSR